MPHMKCGACKGTGEQQGGPGDGAPCLRCGGSGRSVQQEQPPKDLRGGRCACEWHGDRLAVVCIAHLTAVREFDREDGDLREIKDSDIVRGKERDAFISGYKIGYAQPGGFKPREIDQTAHRFADIEFPFLH